VTGVRAVLLVAAACSAAAAQDPREMVRHAVALLDRNLAAESGYSFLERHETSELEPDGRVKTHKIRLYDVTFVDGSPYRRLAGTDDRPLSAEEQRAEQQKLEETVTQRRNETPAQRSKRIAEWEKRRQREREPIKEIPDAFNFRLAGEERVDGRDAWVLEATPRPGFHAHSGIAKLFAKFRGKLWIDKADHQWVKTEAELVDNMWWGVFLARLDKGARLEVQMTRINSEIWLPKHIAAKFSARIALLKRLNMEIDTRYSDYRKLSAASPGRSSTKPNRNGSAPLEASVTSISGFPASVTGRRISSSVSSPVRCETFAGRSIPSTRPPR